MLVIFCLGTAHQTALPTKCGSYETATSFVHARSVKFYKGRHTSSKDELYKWFVTHNWQTPVLLKGKKEKIQIKGKKQTKYKDKTENKNIQIKGNKTKKTEKQKSKTNTKTDNKQKKGGLMRRAHTCCLCLRFNRCTIKEI